MKNKLSPLLFLNVAKGLLDYDNASGHCCIKELLHKSLITNRTSLGSLLLVNIINMDEFVFMCLTILLSPEATIILLLKV